MNCLEGLDWDVGLRLKNPEGFRPGSLPLGSQHHCYLIGVPNPHPCFASSVFWGARTGHSGAEIWLWLCWDPRWSCPFWTSPPFWPDSVRLSPPPPPPNPDPGEQWERDPAWGQGRYIFPVGCGLSGSHKKDGRAVPAQMAVGCTKEAHSKY